MPIYLPWHNVPLESTAESPLFVLEGSVGDGGWQSVVAECILDYLPNASVLVPLLWNIPHLSSHLFHRPPQDDPGALTAWQHHYVDERELVAWKRRCCMRAGIEPRVPGCIIFWFEGEPDTKGWSGIADPLHVVRRFCEYLEVLKRHPAVAAKNAARIAIGGTRNRSGLETILQELGEIIGRPVPFHDTMAKVVAEAMIVAGAKPIRRKMNVLFGELVSTTT